MLKIVFLVSVWVPFVWLQIRTWTQFETFRCSRVHMCGQWSVQWNLFSTNQVSDLSTKV